MISFTDIMRKVLTETMSFKDLWNVSDPKRKQRATHVRPKQMSSRALNNPDAWVFSYKSDPSWSTTGKRWHGYVKLLKEGLANNRNIEIQDVDCMVDCDCPDYRYRWAYNNAKQGAGETGGGTWNRNNGNPPRPREQGGVGDLGPGLCKHLMSLVEYLGTKIEPDAPTPDDKPPRKIKPQKPQPRPVQKPPTIAAPKPEDSYSDSRGDSSGYSDGRELQESNGSLYDKINNFVTQNPTFNVPYED